jgi:PBP1b-binding outer membrane lipoprotein LpoB
MKQTTHLISIAALALLLGGCSSTLIGERLGADQIVVAEATQVGQCKSLGRTTVSVLATLGPITRGNETVEENLVQMARNEAVSKGGDTVVKGNSLEYGKRSFEIFRCK